MTTTPPIPENTSTQDSGLADNLGTPLLIPPRPDWRPPFYRSLAVIASFALMGALIGPWLEDPMQGISGPSTLIEFKPPGPAADANDPDWKNHINTQISIIKSNDVILPALDNTGIGYRTDAGTRIQNELIVERIPNSFIVRITVSGNLREEQRLGIATAIADVYLNKLHSSAVEFQERSLALMVESVDELRKRAELSELELIELCKRDGLSPNDWLAPGKFPEHPNPDENILAGRELERQKKKDELQARVNAVMALKLCYDAEAERMQGKGQPASGTLRTAPLPSDLSWPTKEALSQRLRETELKNPLWLVPGRIPVDEELADLLPPSAPAPAEVILQLTHAKQELDRRTAEWEGAHRQATEAKLQLDQGFSQASFPRILSRPTEGNPLPAQTHWRRHLAGAQTGALIGVAAAIFVLALAFICRFYAAMKAVLRAR